MKKYIIQIPEEESLYVEKLFFEYNAILKVLNYLLKDEEIEQEKLSNFFISAKNKNMELELAKELIVKQHMPQEHKQLNFEFDFENCAIIYQGD